MAIHCDLAVTLPPQKKKKKNAFKCNSKLTPLQCGFADSSAQLGVWVALACGAGMLGTVLLLSQLVRQETEPDLQLRTGRGNKNPDRDTRSQSGPSSGKEPTEATTGSIEKSATREGGGRGVRGSRRLAPATLIIAAAGWGGASLALVLLASRFAGKESQD